MSLFRRSFLGARLRDKSRFRQFRFLLSFSSGSSFSFLLVPPVIAVISRFGSGGDPLRSGVPRAKWGVLEKQAYRYFNLVQFIGFLGEDPEKRQVRGNGANFTVLFRHKSTVVKRFRERKRRQSKNSSGTASWPSTAPSPACPSLTLFIWPDHVLVEY